MIRACYENLHKSNLVILKHTIQLGAINEQIPINPSSNSQTLWQIGSWATNPLFPPPQKKKQTNQETPQESATFQQPKNTDFK